MRTGTKALYDLTASEIVRGITAGKMTCEAVARACLDRIEERESDVLAWQYLSPDRVIKQAQELDQQGVRGPLLGVPFGAKDIIETGDMPTEYGSPIYKGYQPDSDAACITLSRRAGAVLMGKTVTTEFANVYPGENPTPIRPLSHPRRVVKRFGSCGRRSHGTAGTGYSNDVFDYSARLVLWCVWLSSKLRRRSLCGG